MMETWKREQARQGHFHVSILLAHVDVPFAPAKPQVAKRTGEGCFSAVQSIASTELADHSNFLTAAGFQGFRLECSQIAVIVPIVFGREWCGFR